MSVEQLEAMREELWLRHNDTQRFWDADAALWRKVWFAHLTAMLFWSLLIIMQELGF